MKLFKIFNRKKSRGKKKDVNPNPIVMDINNSRYVIEDSVFISIQSTAGDVKVYGWSLEYRFRQSDQYQWSGWWTVNNRVYQSRESTIDAAVKMKLSYDINHEYRSIPLYRMEEPQYRDYKIDKLLNDKKKDVYEIKGWRLKEDYEYYKNGRSNKPWVHKKGSVFIQLENGSIIKSGTCDNQTDRCHTLTRGELFTKWIPNGLVEEINISDEKWLHPHLLKELKIKLTDKK